MANTTVDNLDFDILKLLQEDGRLSYAEIARALGISLGTARYRINKLIEDGTLRVIGRADPYRIGFLAPASIQIAIDPAYLIDDIAAQLGNMPEVSYLAMLTGEYDLEVDLMCRDRDHLTDIINRIRALPGVKGTSTRIILRIYKWAMADLDLVDPRFGGVNSEKPK